MTHKMTIHWFRQDLRLADNPALFEAAKQGNVLPIYILDDKNAADAKMGAASQCWLHDSLAALNEQLQGGLQFFKGDAVEILTTLCKRYNISAVYWNRCYEPWRIKRDALIKLQLSELGVIVKSVNGSLLSEPWAVKKKDGTPYKIFTPYFKQAMPSLIEYPVLPTTNIKPHSTPLEKAISLQALNLKPATSWYKSLEKIWQPGELGAQKSLEKFLCEGIFDYKTGRDFPSEENVSRLSPHLHFGEISPQQILDKTRTLAANDNLEHFKRELMWREFSYYLLFHWPQLPKENLKKNFDHFPWQHHHPHLECWQQGLTGYPIVDAGMRELWQTGFMHNRVRMITASFLVKNLLIHWQQGAAWFWDCLVDADLASNSASWQWVAGCGTDASPYFRIFNPITQGEKFDTKGEYTRKFIPELKDLPNKYLFKPWEAPSDILAKAGVILGKTYPMPIVDLKLSRQKALDAFQFMKLNQNSHMPDK